MFDLCRQDKLFEARAAQEDIAHLRQFLKAGGVASLKAALAARGRDCGVPRPPLQALDKDAADALVRDLDSIEALNDEPRGW
jgi:dihydrodipicolinate synthase/N-acetylneuraminate lyase